MSDRKRILQEYGESVNTCLMQLMKKYSASPDSKEIYIVVEGKDDLSFYDSVFNRRLPAGWQTQVIQAKSRCNVVDAYKKTDGHYPKTQVLFVIDRDLSDFTGEETPQDSNIYVTDYYSIENHLFNSKSFEKVIKYNYGLDDCQDEEIRILVDLFNNAFIQFCHYAADIMKWILYWRINSIHCHLDLIRIKDLFTFRSGIFTVIIQPENLDEVLHRMCGLDFVSQDVEGYKLNFVNHDGTTKFIRGKFIRTFFVKLIDALCPYCEIVLPSHKKMRSKAPLSDANAIALIQGIADCPSTLKEFIDSTCVVYIRQKENSPA